MSTDNIKTNNCNIPGVWDRKGSYRLGDMLMVYDTVDFTGHYLITDKNFEGTILNRFAKKIMKQGGGNRTKICAEVIRDMMKEKEYPKPDDNLVIHIRLGDVFGLDSPLCVNKRPEMDEIINVINRCKEKKIYIVTAYIFGKGEFSAPEVIEKGMKNSLEFLAKIIKNVPSDKVCEIRSSDNADEDFMFLASAKNLVITGGSSFSVAAKKVNKHLHILNM